jgi:signal transduction histidine kinase
MAQVTVHDSGPGIDPQTLHRIFDPFFTTKPKGLGMGLAISRAIIELHGGQLWVESEPGSGASFHFTLPFAP